MIKIVLKIFLTFIISFGFWSATLQTSNPIIFIMIGDVIIPGLLLLFRVFGIVFGIRKIHAAKKIAELLGLMSVWIIAEAIVFYRLQMVGGLYI